MGKARRVLRCFRCGAILQTTNPKEKGYIPKEMLENSSPDSSVLYCHDCFETMKEVNVGNLDEGVESDILKILDDAVASDAFILWVVDLFTFNGLLNAEIVKKIRKLKVVVIGNKRDLFPRNIKDNEFIDFINRTFKESGLTPYSVRIFGAAEKVDYKELIKNLNAARAGHDVYMIGSLYGGKTTIINRFLKEYSNKSRWAVTQEIYPGTRAKVLEIPLSNSAFFYELPSLSLSTSVMSKVEKDVVKFLVPKKAIKISQRTLTTKDSLMIGNLAAFTLVKGKPTLFKLFTSELVESKKVDAKQLEDQMEENYRRRTLRPVSDRYHEFKDYDIFEYDMENDKKKHDIAIRGIGWVSFVATGQVIRVQLPKGAALKETLSKVNI